MKKRISNNRHRNYWPFKDKQTNYLPWILGEVGIFALIAGLIWYFTRKEDK